MGPQRIQPKITDRNCWLKYPYLFCKCFPRTLDKVSSETSDETESEVRLAANLIEVWQTVHDHAHETRLNHEVVLQSNIDNVTGG